MPDHAEHHLPPDGFLTGRLDSISVTSAGFILFLKGDDEARVLPIFIGANEAQSIALALGDEAPARPMTHDLLKAMLESLDATVTRIDITDLREGTFYAKVHATRSGIEESEFDARPSDAIALAVRFDAPIFVARTVFDEAAVSVVSKAPEDSEVADALELSDVTDVGDETVIGVSETATVQPDEAGAENPPPHSPSPSRTPKPLSPADALRRDLDSAVHEERYEDAARLRDALKRLSADN